MNDLYIISGATGMTGSQLSHTICDLNKGKILAFDNFYASSIDTVSDLLSNPNFIFYEWDINNLEQMCMLKKKINNIRGGIRKIFFINCAAVVHTEHFYEVEETFTTNVLSMRSFLQQAIEIGADAFINCSTSEVYSMQSWNAEGGVREDDYLLLATAEHSQRTSYATGKLMTEFFMKDAVEKGKIKGCSIRFANVYSKHERFAKHIIPHIIDQFLNGSTVTLLENSKKNKRTFLHNIDSCNSIMELLANPSALDGSVYNVATDEEISIVDLTLLIAKKMGIENPKIEFKGYRKSDPERRLLSTNKLRERTNWHPVISLNDGIDMCLASINR